MAFVGAVLRFVLRRALVLAAFAAAVLLIPGLPPHTSFSVIELTATQPRIGVLAPNNALDNPKRQFLDEIYGPEALQVHNGALYTSLSTGEVVKVSPGGHVTFVTKIGQPCEGIWQEHKCGRPLGFQIDNAGKYIYIADAYYGIWKVDLKTDKKELLVSPRVNIEGKAPGTFNDLALAKNGDLYWTDSSADFQLKDGSYTGLVDPSGRLFHYNAARNQSRVLINRLWFANGVALSPDEEFVIVNECFASRVHRIFVKGAKTGQKDIFLDGLPGTPDNIQPLADGSGVLISLYTVFDEQHPLLPRSTARFPLLRKFLARLFRLIELPFEYLNDQFPNAIFEKITYAIGHFSSMAPLLPKASGLLQVNWDGKIVGAWFNQDGTTIAISDAVVFQNHLYLGSPHNAFLSTVPAPEQLKLAFTKKSSPPPKASELKKEEPKKPIETSNTKKAAQPVQAKPVEKPVESKTEQPQPVTEKPAAKPVTEKPVASKPVTGKPGAAKPATEKPSAPNPVTEKPWTAKPVTENPAAANPTTEKPDAAKPTTALPPKPALQQPKPTEPPKPKAEHPKKTEVPEETLKKELPKRTEQKVKKDEIPIVEEIKVDTAKPTKEPLKVIKREGPVEIPHPEL